MQGREVGTDRGRWHVCVCVGGGGGGRRVSGERTMGTALKFANADSIIDQKECVEE